MDDAVQSSVSSKQEINHHLRLHRMTVALIYCAGAAATLWTLRLPEAQTNSVALLSSGAILATFGSALSAIGGMLERDLLERVLENVDIFYVDIYKQKKWRRWPFLARVSEMRLLDASAIRGSLKNPTIPVDVGSHVFYVSLPTVLDDLFDLPLLSNVYPLVRFRRLAHTAFRRRSREEINENSGLTPGDEYMAYECLRDVWISVLKVRVARYVFHWGVGLTVASFCAVFMMLVAGIA